MRLTNTTITAALASLLIALVGSCASSADQLDDQPLTADNVRERVSGAMREAGTFSFEWKTPTLDGDETQVWTGAIEYGDDGELEALSLSLRDGEEHRFVDDTLYVNGSGDDEWKKIDRAEKSELLSAWNWADVVDDLKGIESVSDRGEQEINGVDTTEYRFETEETTMTWWLDDEDRVLRWKDEWSEGTLTGYGEPVDINAPQ